MLLSKTISQFVLVYHLWLLTWFMLEYNMPQRFNIISSIYFVVTVNFFKHEVNVGRRQQLKNTSSQLIMKLK